MIVKHIDYQIDASGYSADMRLTTHHNLNGRFNGKLSHQHSHPFRRKNRQLSQGYVVWDNTPLISYHAKEVFATNFWETALMVASHFLAPVHLRCCQSGQTTVRVV